MPSPKHPRSNNSNLRAIARGLVALTLGAAFLVGCDQAPAGITSAAPPGPSAPANTVHSPEEKVLNFSNWPDYIPEQLIARFERESGIKVNYKIFKSNEELMERLSAGKVNDDLVVPSSHFGALQIEKGLLRVLDKGQLPNLANLEPGLMESLGKLDPGNRHLIPWAWGYTTVGINTTRVKQALAGAPLPGNAWELVFNPAYTSKLKSCGIGFLDSPTEVIPAALHHLGKTAESARPEDLLAANSMLARVRPHVRTLSTSLIEDLASGKLCVVLGWSGDINLAISEASSSGFKDQLEVLIPSTGGLQFVDTMAIPSNAPHPQNAHAFVNFFMRPEIAALMSNELSYPTGNLAAMALLKPEVLANTTIFLKEEHVRRLVPPPRLDLPLRIAMTQAYLQFAYGVGPTPPPPTTPTQRNSP
jgi:putrescine transport system substrate-binding protein